MIFQNPNIKQIQHVLKMAHASHHLYLLYFWNAKFHYYKQVVNPVDLVRS